MHTTYKSPENSLHRKMNVSAGAAVNAFIQNTYFNAEVMP